MYWQINISQKKKVLLKCCNKKLTHSYINNIYLVCCKNIKINLIFCVFSGIGAVYNKGTRDLI